MKFLGIESILIFIMIIFLCSCRGNSGEGVVDGDAAGDLILKLSKTVIIADGDDSLTLTVMKGGTDVTGKSKIYIDNEVFEGTTFSTSEAGEYELYASYDGEETEKQIVRAIESGTIPLPNDSRPDVFSNFKHRTLLVQSTGTWCPNCPYVTAAVQKYQVYNNEGNAVFVAAHYGDGMANEYSAKVISWLGISTYPSLTINLNGSDELYKTIDTDALVADISTAVDNNLIAECYTNISSSVSYSQDKKSINVLANVKIAKAGKFRIQAWVLEDGIYEEQSVQPGISGNFDTHNNVLRCSSSKSATGVAIGSKEEQAAETVEQFVCSFEINNLGVENLGRCRVVIVTLNGFSGKFTVDNVAECAIGGTVSYEYN